MQRPPVIDNDVLLKEKLSLIEVCWAAVVSSFLFARCRR